MEWKPSIWEAAGSLPAGLDNRPPVVVGLVGVGHNPVVVGLGLAAHTEEERRILAAEVVDRRNPVVAAVHTGLVVEDHRIVAADHIDLEVEGHHSSQGGRQPCLTSRPWCRSLGRWHRG